MAFYRGIDGSLTIATVSLGQLKSWDITSSIADLDTTSIGDSWKSSVSELASWSGSLDLAVDEALTAQATIWTWFTGATPGGAAVAAEFRISSTTKKLTGNIILKSFAPSVKLGAIDSVKVAFTGTGQLTLAWS